MARNTTTAHKTTKEFLIKNRFPYSIWDGQIVVDHLMITPKEHTDNLSGTPDKGKIEYLDIIKKFEDKGYNIYARAPVSKIKPSHTNIPTSLKPKVTPKISSFC